MAIKKEDIKQLSTEELIAKVQEEKTLMKKLEFNHVISSIDNPLDIRTKRRDIARIYTELRNRELNTAEN